MIILFHSEECKYSIKLIEYIQKNNLTEFFKLINIDTLSKIPENISIVPTIIDSNIEAPLEGKKAFEYVVNHKFFNHPTNNIDFWVSNPIPKPLIEEDTKAIDKLNLSAFANLDIDNESTTQNIVKHTTKPVNKILNKTRPIVINNTNNSNINNNTNNSNNTDNNTNNTNNTDNTNIMLNKKNMALLRLRR